MNQRIETLDYTRGIAVLGILIINIIAFSTSMEAMKWPLATGESLQIPDKIFWVFQEVVGNGKFRGLFTILFGASMVLYLDKHQENGTRLQVKRLIALLGFGLIHYYLIWNGDILTLYAVWGMIALIFANKSGEGLLGFGIILHLAGIMAVMMIYGYAYENTDSTGALESFKAGAIAAATQDIQLYSNANHNDIVAAHWASSGALIDTIVIIGLVETFSLILIGMGLYRVGLFTAKSKKWKAIGWIAAAVGTSAMLYMSLQDVISGFDYETMYVHDIFRPISIFTQTIGAIILLTAYYPKLKAWSLSDRISACGRMAFSNYIGTSIIMTAIFYEWGLGLFGEIGRYQQAGFVLLGWVLMLSWSKPWLTKFHYGPLEWVWRSITKGSFVPLIRK